MTQPDCHPMMPETHDYQPTGDWQGSDPTIGNTETTQEQRLTVCIHCGDEVTELRPSAG